MNPAQPSRPGGRDTSAASTQGLDSTPAEPSTQGDSKAGKTPNSDMQSSDAGTPEGDAGAASDSATAATSVMKQTSKTPAESGTKR